MKKNWFSFQKKQDQEKGSPLTSKGLARLFPRIQKLYQITYIFCTTLSSVSIQHFYTNWFPPRGALGLQCISRAQLIIHITHLPSCFPCHYVTSLLAYCKGQLRINSCIYPIKGLLHIFNYSVKKLSNLQWSFLIIDSSWKNKTSLISARAFRMVINLSKNFRQTQSFFIVSNEKELIFFLEKTRSRETKSLNFKRSSQTFP